MSLEETLQANTDAMLSLTAALLSYQKQPNIPPGMAIEGIIKDSEIKAPAPAPAPKKAEAKKAEAKPPTLEDARAALSKVVAWTSPATARELINKMGYEKLSEVPEDKFSHIINEAAKYEH